MSFRVKSLGVFHLPALLIEKALQKESKIVSWWYYLQYIFINESLGHNFCRDSWSLTPSAFPFGVCPSPLSHLFFTLTLYRFSPGFQVSHCSLPSEPVLLTLHLSLKFVSLFSPTPLYFSSPDFCLVCTDSRSLSQPQEMNFQFQPWSRVITLRANFDLGEFSSAIENWRSGLGGLSKSPDKLNQYWVCMCVCVCYFSIYIYSCI